MATISFFARADSLTANNASLNPIGTGGAQGVPTTTLTFTDMGTGDLKLDQAYDQGVLVADPDTKVIIDNVEYAFKFLLVGTLPLKNSSVPDPLLGKQVAVIEVVVAGVTRQFFFVIDGSGTFELIDEFGTGAIPLDPVDFMPPPTFPCFCTGTRIATPLGHRTIESLAAGDFVLNEDGTACQIIWIGKTVLSLSTLDMNPNVRPICINANSFGPGYPDADLFVSPQHRIIVQGPMAELLFGATRVLVPAKALIGTFAQATNPQIETAYYHMLFHRHEIVMSNGLATESFQPSQHMVDTMAGSAKGILKQTLAVIGNEDILTRKDAVLSLTVTEGRVLAQAMARDKNLGPGIAQNLRQDMRALIPAV